jgi:hypothetical protein
MNKDKSLTERVIVNFSPDDLKLLKEFCRRKRENMSGFIRRTIMETIQAST